MEGEDLLSHESLSRFGLSGKDESLSLLPALADRAVVSTPQRPFHVPAGEEVTVYVGSPVWLQVLAGAKHTTLAEFPIHLPSDTWFGPSPQQGEVCYASRTFCRLQLDALLRRPHRATTALLVQNHSTTALYLERIKLPVPYFSLYCEPGTGDLWTNDVVLKRVDNDELAPLHVREGAPLAVPKATRVAEPRMQADANIMVRAFESLFSDRLGGV